MPTSGIDLEQQPLSPSEAHSALDAVLRSHQFERSERLQRFLRFICELTLTGEAHRINEYLIGSEVFQRGADYSPSEDSIVRRQAHALRQKLQEYYNGEGQQDRVRIELPVGRYVPVFRRAVSAQAAPAAPVAAEPIELAEPPAAAPASPQIDLTRPAETQPPQLPEVPLVKRWLPLAAGALAILVVGVATGFVLRPWVSRATPATLAAEPAVEAIWSPWFHAASGAIICFNNPLSAVIKHFDRPLPEGNQPVRFRFHPDDEKRLAAAFHLPSSQFFYYSPAINQTKVGEAIAGVHLTGLLSRHNVPVRTTQGRFLSWEDLRRDNFILMGHSEANQWLEPLLAEQPFRLIGTTDEHPRGIINVRPQAGEPSEYKIAYSKTEAEADQEYALVSMLPGVDANHPLLLINGLNAQATQIATEFMTAEDSLARLLEQLKKAAPEHKGPWHFQAVLRTEVYDKVPVRANLEAVRVLDHAKH